MAFFPPARAQGRPPGPACRGLGWWPTGRPENGPHSGITPATQMPHWSFDPVHEPVKKSRTCDRGHRGGNPGSGTIVPWDAGACRLREGVGHAQSANFHDHRSCARNAFGCPSDVGPNRKRLRRGLVHDRRRALPTGAPRLALDQQYRSLFGLE